MQTTSSHDTWLKGFWWPALALLLLVGLFPILVVWLSFLINSPSTIANVLIETFGIARIENLRTIFIRAATVATISVIISTPFSIWLAERSSGRVLPLIIALLIAPFFVNDAVRAFAWAELLNEKGAIGYMVGLFGPNVGVGFGLSYHPYSSIIPLIAATLPFCVLICAGGLSARMAHTSKFYIELGLPAKVKMLYVTLPTLVPFQILSWFISFGFGFSSSSEEQYVGGPLQISVNTTMTALQRVGISHAMTFICAVVVVSVVCAAVPLLYLSGRHKYYVERFYVSKFFANTLFGSGNIEKTALGDHVPQQFLHWQKIAKTCRVLLIVLLILFLWLPLFTVMQLSVQNPVAGVKGIHFQNFSEIFESNRMLLALANTFLVASVVGAIGVVFANLSVWMGMASRFSISSAIIIIAMVLAPPEGTGVALQQVALWVGASEGSLWLATFGVLTWTIPFTLMLAFAWGRGLDEKEIVNLPELNISRFTIWQSVVSSRARAVNASCFLVSFLLTLNEYTRFKYLGGASENLSSVVYGRLSSGSVEGERAVFAMCTIILITTAAGVLIAARMMSSAFDNYRHLQN